MIPDKIMQIATGGWACGILGAAATHSLFNHLEQPATVADVAARAKISSRGAQTLLDGLLGLGFITLAGGRYQNSPDASAFLVEGKPTYMGGLAKLNLAQIGEWSRFPEVAQTGVPPAAVDVAENPFWEQLVPSIAALSFPVAQLAGERLNMAAGAPIWLDVGGGSGVWSAVWLGMNRQAKAAQLDWANVNRLAKGFVAKFGAADRFATIDGDFHTAALGGPYDVVIYSHVAHQETPESNVAMFRRFRQALRPGGTLLINDFILNDDRTGHPFALIFHAQMLNGTKGGATYRRADYLAWLGEAGFAKVTFEPTPTPSTLVYAS